MVAWQCSTHARDSALLTGHAARVLEIVTFALAIAGFVLLAWCAAFAAAGQRPRWLLLLTTVVVLVHVALVWGDRYGGSIAQATRNGYTGFALFHTALAALVAANVVGHRRGTQCVLFTFLVVCIGANGAIWRYDVVAIYRIPVIAVTVVGLVTVVRRWARSQSRSETSRTRQTPSSRDAE